MALHIAIWQVDINRMTLRGLTPRDPQEALMLGGYVWMFPALYLTAKLCMDAATLVGIGEEARPVSHMIIDAVLATVCLVCAAAFRKMPTEWADKVIFPFVVVGVVMLALGNISGEDASAGAQMMYMIPTVYAAYTLRKQGSWCAWALIVASIIVNSVFISPYKVAMMDSVFMTAVVSLTVFATQGVRNRSEAVRDALIQQAQTDPLTGLGTRQVLDSALLAAVENTTEDTVLFIVDCDNFKHINDAFGHPVGDEALRHIATVLQTVHSDSSRAFRIGGDELAVLAYRCDYQHAQELAHTIVDAVASAPLPGSSGEGIELSVSVGVAHYPHHAQDVEELYLVADAALYVAKRGGRGRAGFPEELTSEQGTSKRPLEKGPRPSA